MIVLLRWLPALLFKRKFQRFFRHVTECCIETLLTCKVPPVTVNSSPLGTLRPIRQMENGNHFIPTYPRQVFRHWQKKLAHALSLSLFLKPPPSHTHTHTHTHTIRTVNDVKKLFGFFGILLLHGRFYFVIIFDFINCPVT